MRQVRPEAAGYRLQASGFGGQESGFRKKRADSLQQTADSERKARREKRKGNSPSPLIPFDRITTPLSLGGARKIKETGYHRPPAAYLKEKQYEHY